RRSGERTEERGGHLLSQALSSIRWRRGSVALRLGRSALYRRFNLPAAVCEQHSADYKSAIRQIKNLRYTKQTAMSACPRLQIRSWRTRLSALLFPRFLNPLWLTGCSHACIYIALAMHLRCWIRTLLSTRL